MSWIIDFLMSWGYWGMLVSAFLAGSFFPFSSEVVMSGLQAAGLEPIQLVLYGSIGNVLGSMFNYGVGRMGKLEWIEKYLHVKKESLDKAQNFMADRGAGWDSSLPAPVGKCHHHRLGTDESQHRDFCHQHHHRKGVEICTAGLRTQFYLLNKLQRKQRIDSYRLTAYEKVFIPYYIMCGFRGL